MTMESVRYACAYVGEGSGGIPWENIQAISLREVVTGERPRLRTDVKACWTSDALHIRFECEDDFIAAEMTRRDDPLYDEDVVEVFIDEEGSGRAYMEFEINPLNTIFDARIVNDTKGSIQVDTAWDAEGLATAVTREGETYKYDIALPLSNFEKRPEAGTTWRWNVYRIDRDPQGERHFWAWSPTGAVDFHRSHRFGTLVFVAP